MKAPAGRTAAGVALLMVVLAMLSFALREVFTSRVPGGNDLYPRWAAGCAWLTSGQDPYSPQATRRIQQGIYGRAARPDEDQTAFAYPAYTVLLTWPLCLTPDFATAQAAAMTLLAAAIVLTAILARDSVGWNVHGLLWAWTLAWAVLMYPSARGLLLGQLAIVVALLQVGAVEALRRSRDSVAGALLALSTIKPQMALLLVPVLLFWSAWHRRWRVLAAFGVAMVLLIGLPLIWLPRWPAEWLAQLSRYTAYTELGSVTWILTSYYLGSPPALGLALTIGLAAWLAVEVWRGRRQPFEPMLWVAALSIVLTHFVSPRTATTHFGPLLIPLFMLFRWLQHRDARRGRRAVAWIMPLVGVTSWVLFLMTVQGRQESALNYLPIPLALLAMLVWIRRPWLAMTAKAE